jgi:hypothetical protein
VGKELTESRVDFVSFEPAGDGFTAWFHLSETVTPPANTASLLKKASIVYKSHLGIMRLQIERMQGTKLRSQRIPAFLAWSLGDQVFRLISELRTQSLEISGVYAHLTRDLGVNRKWLEKVIVFRRYIPSADCIPKELSWGQCQTGTRRIALDIVRRSNAGR